jgi:hypothetical protein
MMVILRMLDALVRRPLGCALTALTLKSSKLGRSSRMNGIGPDPQLGVRKWCLPALRSDWVGIAAVALRQ